MDGISDEMTKWTIYHATHFFKVASIIEKKRIFAIVDAQKQGTAKF